MIGYDKPSPERIPPVHKPAKRRQCVGSGYRLGLQSWAPSDEPRGGRPVIESPPAELVLATPPAIAYYNLSRGVLCNPPADARFMRLQSTWCEQKRWEDVLWTTPPDLLYHLARGHTVVVHDQSEKLRPTRAQWQGLSWIRYVCSTAWYGSAPVESSRSGMNITPYWAEQYDHLGDRVLTYVGRFKEWATGQPVLLAPCACGLPEGQVSAA